MENDYGAGGEYALYLSISFIVYSESVQKKSAYCSSTFVAILYNILNGSLELTFRESVWCRLWLADTNRWSKFYNKQLKMCTPTHGQAIDLLINRLYVIYIKYI